MSVVIRRISLVLALALLTAGVVFAQKTYEDYMRKYNWRQTDAYIQIKEMSLKLSPKEPHLSDIVTVTGSVTSPEDVSRMMIGFASPVGIEFVSGKEREIYWTDFKENETKEFSSKVKFVSSPAALLVRVLGRVRTSDGVRIPVEGGTGFRLVVIDEETGRFGTVGGYLDRVEFRYNPAVANWEPEPHEGLGPRNREIIGAFRKLEPALTDSEALCLHYDFHNIPYLYWAPPKEGKEKLTDEDVARHLLEQGWLKKHREGGKAKEKWLKALSERNRKRQEELRKKRE